MYEIILKENRSKVWYVENPCFCTQQENGSYIMMDAGSGNCVYLQETGLYYAIEGRLPLTPNLPIVYVGIMGGEEEIMSYKEMTENIKTTDSNVQINSDSIDDLWVAVLEG